MKLCGNNCVQEIVLCLRKESCPKTIRGSIDHAFVTMISDDLSEVLVLIEVRKQIAVPIWESPSQGTKAHEMRAALWAAPARSLHRHVALAPPHPHLPWHVSSCIKGSPSSI